MDILMDAFKAYDLLRGSKEDQPSLQRFLSNNIIAGNVIFSRSGVDVVGLAVAWRIADPLDINEAGDYPGIDPNGKYVYVPVLHVRQDYRLNGEESLWVSPVLKDLMKQIFEKFTGVKAIVGRRGPERRAPQRRRRGRPKRPSPRDTRRLHILRGKL